MHQNLVNSRMAFSTREGLIRWDSPVPVWVEEYISENPGRSACYMSDIPEAFF